MSSPYSLGFAEETALILLKNIVRNNCQRLRLIGLLPMETGLKLFMCSVISPEIGFQ
jgi:hypothetical protein